MTQVGLPLTGLEVAVRTGEGATGHAGRLLASLGARAVERPEASGPALIEAMGHAVVVDPAGESDAAWATSGAMWLTGTDGGPPLLPPGGGATAARGAMGVFELLSAFGPRRVALPGHRLLGEHAAAGDFFRRGPASANGASRIMRSIDGHVVLSLARPDDIDGVPALIGGEAVGDAWSAVATWVSRTPAAVAVERAQLLGIAAAVIPDHDRCRRDEQAVHRRQADGFEPYVINGEVAHPVPHAPHLGRFRPRVFAPLVVDLSSLWAGPLCAHLLGLAGARVVKVESARRPDGARFGPPALFDLLHGGHESVALDFTDAADVDRLRRLIGAADVVIEASRPRVMDHLGIDPADVARRQPDVTWLSLTAYGRTGPWANRVGFGDDSALAAGLVAVDPESGALVPCGDAIADPLTGIHAAVAVLASVLGGGSRVIDIALRDVVASTLPFVDQTKASRAARRCDGEWKLDCSSGLVTVEPPTIRYSDLGAPALGEQTAAVLDELGIS